MNSLKHGQLSLSPGGSNRVGAFPVIGLTFGLLLVALISFGATAAARATKFEGRDSRSNRAPLKLSPDSDPARVKPNQPTLSVSASGCSTTANLGSPPASGTTGTVTTRLFRGGTQGLCGSNSFPGNTGSGSFPYDAYTFTNPSSSPVCVGVALTVNSQTNADYQIVAMLAPFSPPDLSNPAKYLGDSGTSSGSPPSNPMDFSFSVPGGASFAIVIYAVNGAAGLGGSYTFSVSSSSFCSASLPALYGASTNGELFTVDLNTGAGTFVGNLPFGTAAGSTEIVFNNATRQSFDEFSPGTSGFFGGQQFDITTGAGIGGLVPTGGAFNGLEWVGSTLFGTMITSGQGASQLRTLDPVGGSSTLIGATGMGPIAGLAYDQAASVMYGITGGASNSSSSLVTINLTTGAATTIGSVGFNAGSLEFGPDGSLYGGSSGTGGGNLYRIDKSTGVSTLIGPTGFGPLTGLTLVNAPASNVQFDSPNYVVSEGNGRATINITRTGDTSSNASVSYATSDTAGSQSCNVVNGVASSRCDYISALGAISFAVGETSKTVSILLIDDSYAESNESFTITLSNPTGGTLGTQSTATVTITDNDPVTSANPIDQTGFFVTEHYYDFLNRQPDAAGLAFWTNEITSCGTNVACIEAKRVNTSGAFYLSIEFQQTGYLVERMYKTSYGAATGASTLGSAHTLSVPIIRLSEFLPDTQRIGQGVIVGQGDWQTALENNKQAFCLEFVQRSRFTTAFPTTLTPAQFVDALNTNAGSVLSASDRMTAINLFGDAGNTTSTTARAQALRQIAEDPDLVNAEFTRAFVLMQYFGYLRRDPNATPDADYTGYDFWLQKLNAFNGSFLDAEMVKAFLSSLEYRQRFGP
jgi:Calx-beta domain